LTRVPVAWARAAAIGSSAGIGLVGEAEGVRDGELDGFALGLAGPLGRIVRRGVEEGAIEGVAGLCEAASVDRGDATALAVEEPLGPGVVVGDGVGFAVAAGVEAVHVGVAEAGAAEISAEGVQMAEGSGTDAAAVGVDVPEAETLGSGVGMPADGGSEAGGPDVEGSVEDELGAPMGVAEIDGSAERPGAGAEARDCGIGFDCTNQSDRLSFVSWVLPAVPPGKRSMLDLAGGAGAADPST